MSNPAWFDHVWNAVDSGCQRECCAAFVLRRDLNILKHLREGTRVLVGPTDLFSAHVPDYVVRDLLLIMARNHHARFRVLTRNYDRMDQFFGCWEGAELQGWIEEAGHDWPIVNIEIGVTARDQDTADAAIGALVSVPAHHRFVFIDRLKGEVDLEAVTCPSGVYLKEQVRACRVCVGGREVCVNGNYNALREGINEVILAEPVFRPDHSDEPVWRGNIVTQCEKNNVSVIRPRLPRAWVP